MVWSINDPQGQQTFVPGHVVVGFRDNVTAEQAKWYIDHEIKPLRVTFDFRDHPQLGALRRADIRVEPGTEEQVMEKLAACPLVDPALVARMLKPILMGDHPAERLEQFERERGGLTGEEAIDITGIEPTLKKLDHEWIAKQLGAEIVGKVEGPIHGMAGVANLTRQYQKRMKEIRDEAEKGDVGGPDGGGPSGPPGSKEDGA